MDRGNFDEQTGAAIETRRLDDFTFQIHEWPNRFRNQLRGQESFAEHRGTAVEIAADLRAADAKYEPISEEDRAEFIKTYKEYAEKHPDFAYEVARALLEVIYDLEEDRGWNLEPMSEWLQKHCVEIMKKELEKVRGTDDYHKILFEIGGLYRRAHPSDNPHEQMFAMKFPEIIDQGLEEMLTAEEKVTFADSHKP